MSLRVYEPLDYYELAILIILTKNTLHLWNIPRIRQKCLFVFVYFHYESDQFDKGFSKVRWPRHNIEDASN